MRCRLGSVELYSLHPMFIFSLRDFALKRRCQVLLVVAPFVFSGCQSSQTSTPVGPNC